MNAAEIKVGDTIVGKPFGQTRRQRIHVTQIVDLGSETPALVMGFLWSAKYPGDYRGQASLFVDAVESVKHATD